eukprot:TRINITY_DN9368_c1_g2_i2.p1 TRINITY_DN9368_c1_g2~~TRINITY_DN9368_c1_g2_i2.p1  ORF type:complete len:127 (+),score=1.57 TRINITY_DN9368_c1_g2_i2:237-617(+)
MGFFVFLIVKRCGEVGTWQKCFSVVQKKMEIKNKKESSKLFVISLIGEFHFFPSCFYFSSVSDFDSVSFLFFSFPPQRKYVLPGISLRSKAYCFLMSLFQLYFWDTRIIIFKAFIFILFFIIFLLS